MLIGIIKNIDKTYEYLYKINNELISFHVDNNGFSKSNKSYIAFLISKFKYNKDCEYISKFKEYDVYYDPNTKLKHFLLNQEEDYDMLFRFNGMDARYYKDKRSLGTWDKILITLGITAVFTYGGLLFLLGSNYDMNVKESVYSSYGISTINEMYDYEPINYEDAINYINSSDISNEVKSVITNEDFLKLVFSYYKNTPLEYTARIKLDGINIKSFQENPKDPDTNGYYTSTDPNTLYIKEGQKKDYEDRNTIHEFIHLLQAEGSPYYYLNEAVAELMTSELLDSSPSTYFGAVDNLKLLINIIGPEPIYELSFGGDDTSLNNILKEYLSNKDIITLKYYLQKSGLELNQDNNINVEIQNILHKLYKNMYGSDINDDKNIISILTDEKVSLEKNIYVNDKRYFLLPNKMKEKESITIVSPNMNVLAKNGYLNEKKCYKELVKIEENEYEKYENASDVVLKENLNTDKSIYGKIMGEGNECYYRHLKNPINKEDYEYFSFRTLPADRYSIKEAIDKGYISVYEVLYTKEKTNDNQEEYIYYESNDPRVIAHDNNCEFIVDGLKTRFEQQYDNLLKRIDDKDYHK